MRKVLLMALVIIIILSSQKAEATTVELGFDSLPSAQGWTPKVNYGQETDYFSVDGTKLTVNTMGYGNGYGAWYEMNNVVDPDLPFNITFTARTIEYETFDPSWTGGFWLPGVVLNPDYIRAGGQNWAFDTTSFHTYRIEAIPRVPYDLFVDDAFLTQLNTPIAFLGFGDGGSHYNINGEMTFFRFSQNITPEPVSSTLYFLGSATLGLYGFIKRKRFRKKA